MSGDEWRLDVRTLVWTGLAAELGLPDSFRLDRLSGRYLRTELADDPTPTPAAAPAAESGSCPPRPRQFCPERRGRSGRRHLGAGPDGFRVESARRCPPRLRTMATAGGRCPVRRFHDPGTGPGRGRARRAPGERSGRKGDALHWQRQDSDQRLSKDVRLRRFQQSPAPRPGTQPGPVVPALPGVFAHHRGFDPAVLRTRREPPQPRGHRLSLRFVQRADLPQVRRQDVRGQSRRIREQLRRARAREGEVQLHLPARERRAAVPRGARLLFVGPLQRLRLDVPPHGTGGLPGPRRERPAAHLRAGSRSARDGGDRQRNVQQS